MICKVLAAFKTDALLRHLNRNKLLVVMYHGITEKSYDPPVCTQLPVETFREQIEFLKSSYNVISLSMLIESIRTGAKLPERAALITFDDGLRNNYSVAFPILKELNAAATIFLTTDFIDTDKILWFDELLFLLKDMKANGKAINDDYLLEHDLSDNSSLWDAYVKAVGVMKRMRASERDRAMDKLRQIATIDPQALADDFGILSWNQIKEMDSSGLIDFGAHTASHNILTTIEQNDWQEELDEPRRKISNMLGKDVLSFCYPNGIPLTDFNESHIEHLKKCGYSCAFSAETVLCNLDGESLFNIGRIPAGNDFSSYPSFFKMACAGFNWY